jgi:hypothetical protein
MICVQGHVASRSTCCVVVAVSSCSLAILSTLTLFCRQYSYTPSSRQQEHSIPPPNFSYEQTDSIHQAQGRRQSQRSLPSDAHIPTSSYPVNNHSVGFRSFQQPSAAQPQNLPADSSLQMPPPPIPRAVPSNSTLQDRGQRGSFLPPPSTPQGPRPGQTHNRRFMDTTSVATNHAGSGNLSAQSPNPSGLRVATPALQTQRFVPSTPASRQQFTSSVPGAAGSSRLKSGLIRTNSTANALHSVQRLPFVPSAQGGVPQR